MLAKTFLEQKYENAVKRRIGSLGYPKEEEKRLLSEFLANGHNNYCDLCDALYAVSTGQDMKPIWITETGECYLSLFSRNKTDRILAFPDEIPPFTLDLVNQLDTVINKI